MASTSEEIVITNEIVNRLLSEDSDERDEVCEEFSARVEVDKIEPGFNWSRLCKVIYSNDTYCSAAAVAFVVSLIVQRRLPNVAKRPLLVALQKAALMEVDEEKASFYYLDINRTIAYLERRITAKQAWPNRPYA